jgi:hypothetical protein
MRGTVIIPPQFFATYGFSEGLAATQVEQWAKAGYIDKRGRVVVPPQFEKIDSFKDGRARVCVATT